MNHEEEKESIYKLLINQATFNSKTNQLYLTKSKYKRLKSTLKILLYDERKKHIDSVLAELVRDGTIKEERIVMSSQLTHVPAYIFSAQDLEKYKIHNNEILIYMSHMRHPFAIRMYAYLYSKYEQQQNSGGKEYEFTINELLDVLGWPKDEKFHTTLIEINLLSLFNERIIIFKELSGEGNYARKLLKFAAAREEQLIDLSLFQGGTDNE